MDNGNYGTAPYQRELLQLGKDLDAFCEQNGIRYSLAGGTLIGAIRHNGFIPWDDDFDIMLDRENYNRFLKAVDARGKQFNLVRGRWLVRAEYSDDRGKIGDWRPSADLFVNDHIPRNPLVYKTKVLTVKMLQGMMKDKVDLSEYSRGYRVCLVATRCLGKLFPDKVKYGVYKKVSQIGNKKDCDYVAAFNDEFHLLTKKYSGRLMDGYEKHVFEDTELWITKEYDNYLTVQYGDYMALPSEDDRVPLHLDSSDR